MDTEAKWWADAGGTEQRIEFLLGVHLLTCRQDHCGVDQRAAAKMPVAWTDVILQRRDGWELTWRCIVTVGDGR